MCTLQDFDRSLQMLLPSKRHVETIIINKASPFLHGRWMLFIKMKSVHPRRARQPKNRACWMLIGQEADAKSDPIDIHPDTTRSSDSHSTFMRVVADSDLDASGVVAFLSDSSTLAPITVLVACHCNRCRIQVSQYFFYAFA